MLRKSLATSHQERERHKALSLCSFVFLVWHRLWRPIVRTALLCLVVPAVIADADQRGLHDRVAATVLVRR